MRKTSTVPLVLVEFEIYFVLSRACLSVDRENNSPWPSPRIIQITTRAAKLTAMVSRSPKHTDTNPTVVLILNSCATSVSLRSTTSTQPNS
ncbi:Ribosomal protein L29 [Carabus blaptoides fortunei]